MKGTAIRDRVHRARALVEAGRVHRVGDVHLVEGNGGTYTVGLEAETCDCKAGTRGMACYHLAAVEVFEAGLRAAKPKVRRPNPLASGIANMDVIDRMAERLGVA